MKDILRNTIRPIAVIMTSPVIGFVLVFLVETILNIEVSKLVSALINLLVVSLIAFVLLPIRFGIPFGKLKTSEFLRKVGFYIPEKPWKHALLGLVLAGCTLTGMLVASTLTGKYSFNLDTVNLSHLVFCLNPALWEELFYRGILMLFLLGTGKSLRQAAIIQIILFGLAHIKGFDFWSLFDTVSVVVIAIGFTYVAYKTRNLLAGIVFHYFHDALLFLVQLPNSIDKGVIENITFYGLLWSMVGIGCLITKLAVDRLWGRPAKELYALGTEIPAPSTP